MIFILYELKYRCGNLSAKADIISSRVSQVVEFDGKEGKYRKSEETDVFYLKKKEKIEKKILKSFDQSESWKLKMPRGYQIGAR